jgi:hypothetical protein
VCVCAHHPVSAAHTQRGTMTLSVAQASEHLRKLAASAGEGWRPRQVTICGGGNGAHVSAAFLASQGIR